MRNINTMNFEIEINTSAENVWHKMLDKDTYSVWCEPFNPGGSYYEKDNEGDFVEGEKIKFLGPDGQGQTGGMLGIVKTVRKYEFISFEYYGYLMNGVEDTESENVKSWAPAHENYTFEKVDENKTLLKIDLESDPQYTEMFRALWPKALEKLKQICEA